MLPSARARWCRSCRSWSGATSTGKAAQLRVDGERSRRVPRRVPREPSRARRARVVGARPTARAAPTPARDGAFRGRAAHRAVGMEPSVLTPNVRPTSRRSVFRAIAIARARARRAASQPSEVDVPRVVRGLMHKTGKEVAHSSVGGPAAAQRVNASRHANSARACHHKLVARPATRDPDGGEDRRRDPRLAGRPLVVVLRQAADDHRRPLSLKTASAPGSSGEGAPGPGAATCRPTAARNARERSVDGDAPKRRSPATRLLASAASAPAPASRAPRALAHAERSTRARASSGARARRQSRSASWRTCNARLRARRRQAPSASQSTPGDCEHRGGDAAAEKRNTIGGARARAARAHSPRADGAARCPNRADSRAGGGADNASRAIALRRAPGRPRSSTRRSSGRDEKPRLRRVVGREGSSRGTLSRFAEHTWKRRRG